MFILIHRHPKTPQHEPYSIENLSPLPEGATLQQIKDACVAVKRKISFSDDEIVIVEKKKKTDYEVNVQIGIALRRGAFLPQNRKELPVLNPLLPQLRL